MNLNNHNFRNQIIKNRIDRVYRKLKELPNFLDDFTAFAQEEARLQASNILTEKDPPRTEFTHNSLMEFSFEKELEKFLRTNPLLSAVVIGTMSKDKVYDFDDLCRKGFGGSNRSIDIDLVPSIVLTLARILKNRHPTAIVTIPCLTSLFLWTNRASGHVFHFCNSLGDSFRYINKYQTHL